MNRNEAILFCKLLYWLTPKWSPSTQWWVMSSQVFSLHSALWVMEQSSHLGGGNEAWLVHVALGCTYKLWCFGPGAAFYGRVCEVKSRTWTSRLLWCGEQPDDVKVFPAARTGCMRYCVCYCTAMGPYRKTHSRLKQMLLFLRHVISSNVSSLPFTQNYVSLWT